MPHRPDLGNSTRMTNVGFYNHKSMVFLSWLMPRKPPAFPLSTKCLSWCIRLNKIRASQYYQRGWCSFLMVSDDSPFVEMSLEMYLTQWSINQLHQLIIDYIRLILYSIDWKPQTTQLRFLPYRWSTLFIYYCFCDSNTLLPHPSSLNLLGHTKANQITNSFT